MDSKYTIKDARLPNLGSILMVESFLRKQKKAATVADIRKGLPKQVMHQTLKIIIEYLWESKKIDATPQGYVWVFEGREK